MANLDESGEEEVVEDAMELEDFLTVEKRLTAIKAVVDRYSPDVMESLAITWDKICTREWVGEEDSEEEYTPVPVLKIKFRDGGKLNYKP